MGRDSRAVQTSSQATRFRFADLTLDVGQRRVARDGQTLHFGKLTYEMLVTLVEAAPNVVAHDRLAERVWGGRVATPETVAQRVKLLRLALDDDPSHPRYVEVVRGQGYRLIPPVEQDSETVAPAVSEPRIDQPSARPAASEPAAMPERAPSAARPSRRPQRWLTAGVLLAATGIGAFVWFARDQKVASPPVSRPSSATAMVKSIAVLPFADMSEGKNQQYIADGIAEEILDRLAQNEGLLRVIARTSSFYFRDRPAQIPEIASKLNVSHVLEGSVRRSGDRIRISVQLVEGAGATHVWSETYDHELGELFGVQDEIASAVAAALQVALADGSRGDAKSVSAESQEDFLQAKFFYERRAPGDIERSVRYLEAAVARDPQFAKAWAALSGSYSLMWWEGGHDPAIWRARQGEAARKAVEADPQLLEARLRLGRYYWDVSDRTRGFEQHREAAKLDPDDPWLATIARGTVPWQDFDLEQDIRSLRDELQDDPLSPMKRFNLGLVLLRQGHLDEALSEFQRGLELNPDAGWDKELEAARVLVAQKRYGDAQVAFLRLPAEARDYGLALLHHAPGQTDQADAALSRLRARPMDDYMHGIRVAEALTIRGMNDEAFAALWRSRDTLPRDESILTRLWTFQRELRLAPFLKPLQGDARWNALMARPEGNNASEIIRSIWPSAQSASVKK